MNFFYKEVGNPSIVNQLKLIREYPSFFNVAEGELVARPVTLEEVKKVLEESEKSLRPGLDAWTVDFFLSFFDAMGKDLLDVVEESRISRKVYGALNATFISLILKKDKPQIFQDYRPIALCNLVYKWITKIIANRINPVLSKYISKQQFGFLEDRQISDVVGITQEGLHSIEVKQTNTLVLKIYLIKSYDRVNWDFLILVLLHIGISLEDTN